MKTLRKRAEIKAGADLAVAEVLPPERAQEILRELRVHQIELEMQNEELRRVHKELEASRERYFDLYDLAPVGYFTLSQKGLVVKANLTVAKLLGMKRGGLVGRPLSQFILFADHSLYGECFKRIFETGEPQSLDLRLVKLDGSQVWAHLEATLAEGGDELPVCRAVLSDITERKEAEEALRQAHDETEQKVELRTRELQAALDELQHHRAERERLSRQLLKISEREKQLIAQELHDGLCQHFAGTAMMAALLVRRLEASGSPDAAQAKHICELLNLGVAETRNLSHGLHPVKSEGEGLMEALLQYSKTTTNLFHIRCSFRCGKAVVIESQAVATHFFRIAQEAVNNAMKHGEASHIIITLRHGRAGITLSIRDNGIGIPRELANTRGMGLQIMQHRADTIGATLEVRRGTRGGTIVSCTVGSG